MNAMNFNYIEVGCMTAQQQQQQQQSIAVAVACVSVLVTCSITTSIYHKLNVDMRQPGDNNNGGDITSTAVTPAAPPRPNSYRPNAAEPDN